MGTTEVARIETNSILVDTKSVNYAWYVCAIRYYEAPTSDWVLGCTQSQKKKDAMKFCEKKAKKIAEILNNQEDEEGFSAQWEVVEV